MPASPQTTRLIELRIRELSQLFNSMDPTPFHHKDLDPDAEEFIVSWALEHPRGADFDVVIHLENPPQEHDTEAIAREAIHNYFNYRATHAEREFRHLMQRGRTSLAIGLLFLASCLLGAEALAAVQGGTLITILRESLTIGGWVAMWRPLEIFLYDWWPIRQRRAVYEMLGRAAVRVLPAGS